MQVMQRSTSARAYNKHTHTHTLAHLCMLGMTGKRMKRASSKFPLRCTISTACLNEVSVSVRTPSQAGQIYAFRTHNPRNLHHTDLEYGFLQSCQTMFPGWAMTAPLPYPKYLDRVMIKLENKEKSFGRSPHALISDMWRRQLRSQPPHTGESVTLQYYA